MSEDLVLTQPQEVAIPPYRSGKFQVGGWWLIAIIAAVSQSHRTDQGSSKDSFSRSSEREQQKSQSHRTDQGSSKEESGVGPAATRKVAIPPYRSGKFQGSTSTASKWQRSEVAIPPYRSGKFQATPGRPRSSPARKSQSHRTDQGSSKPTKYVWRMP